MFCVCTVLATLVGLLYIYKSGFCFVLFFPKLYVHPGLIPEGVNSFHKQQEIAHFFFFFFVFLRLHPWYMEFPRLGVESEL